MKYIVEDTQSFNQLLKDKKSYITDVAFNFSSFTHEENLKYGKKFNKYYFACGCDTGTYFMLGAIILVVLLYFFNANFVTLGLVKWIIYSVIFVIVFSIIGKLVGLLSAKIKLNILIRNIKKQLKSSDI